jgi:hypothetical protein
MRRLFEKTSAATFMTAGLLQSTMAKNTARPLVSPGCTAGAATPQRGRIRTRAVRRKSLGPCLTRTNGRGEKGQGRKAKEHTRQIENQRQMNGIEAAVRLATIQDAQQSINVAIKGACSVRPRQYTLTHTSWVRISKCLKCHSRLAKAGRRSTFCFSDQDLIDASSNAAVRISLSRQAGSFDQNRCGFPEQAKKYNSKPRRNAYMYS